MDNIPNIGQEIRRLRKWRDLTLQELADLSGLSKGYLSKIENNNASLDKRTTIKAIADALRVSIADLIGDHFLVEQSDGDVIGSVPDIRIALLSSGLEGPADAPLRAMTELATTTQQVAEWRQLCRDLEVGHALPGLITDLHSTAVGGGNDGTAALRSIVQATHTTTLFLKSLGAVDLAWVAAERGHQAAIMLDDPLYIAASEFARSQALIGLGAYQRADRLAQNAAALLTSPKTEADFEIYGTSVITTAFTAQIRGDDPEEAIREAMEAAKRTSGTNAFWMNFSRTNVNQWRMSIALEADDPVKAAEVAREIRASDIPAKSRRVAFFIDHARALHSLHGHDAEVVSLLKKADKLGPTRTRNSIWAREIVSELVHRARRDAGGIELRGLADRMGLLSAL
ncbi:helix-turn-helix transcriptional regulator [Kribbella sp. NPDC056861]|uniref:helix-turn-helix domain-containing protein n=1 Tax=Kribbella sp. NPDC056861 TaxID=3154857 RepID=UPI003424B784